MIAALETEPGAVGGAPESKIVPGAGAAPVADSASYLVSGTSALGAGLIVERGLGFLANLLAARLGGAGTFGAYSFAIATANNIGTYAAGGIGATATRFSGKYPRGTAGYPTLARVLLLVSIGSAALAAAILWLGSAPLARVLHQPNLTGVLRWAAFSAAGMILLECGRGFFVGQRRLLGILSLSLLVGVGMIALLPAMAHFGPIAMVCSQGIVTLGAIGLCLACYKPLGLRSPIEISHPKPAMPIFREVWSFTLVQLAGVIGMNAAGYWLTSLVAQADSTMAQMSFYAIGNQLRNMVALAPGLLSQSSLAIMAEPETDGDRVVSTSRPDRIMAVCTFIATFVSVTLAGIGIAIAPWGLSHLYGKSYVPAATATALSLATAVVHMGNAPAAGRLTIVSIQTTGVINSIWAAVVAAAACVFFVVPGSAGLASAVILIGHILSAMLVLVALKAKSTVPAGMTSLFVIGTATSSSMAVVSILRTQQSASALGVTALLYLILLIGLSALFFLAKKHDWVPNIAPLLTAVRSRFPILRKTIPGTWL